MQNTSNLTPGTLLKNGEYRIEQFLGQGGFGITYAAVQVSLGRKVAIKEFFMKGVCERNAGTSQVSVSNADNDKLVSRYRDKFLKEARNIASLEHPNIVPIIDVFECNGTAYYVMKHFSGASLAGKVLHGALPEEDAVRYTRQVADALDFVHSKRMMHLDVKPANILLDDNDNAVLIDFGLAKQYDIEGHQTSSTPVGISHGYAPLEQYKRGGVSTFSPATDIYSLGATLFKLVTGITPPEASDVNDEGLPVLPSDISTPVRRAIEAAMEPKRKDRPQSVAEFLSLLESTDKREQSTDNRVQRTDNRVQRVNVKAVKEQSEAIKEESEETRALEKETERATAKINDPVTKPKINRATWVVAVLGVLIGCGLFFAFSGGDGSDYPVDDISEQGISTEQKVDLGLSVCWAGWNVGATSPEGYGAFFAWGETTTKSDYAESSYQYYNGSYIDIGSNISGTKYDVARAQWGGNWRMPTEAEIQELEDRCTWTWTTYNNVNGYRVTGPNGNSIFLPAAGSLGSSGLNIRGIDGYYWSGSLTEGYQGDACGLYFNSGGSSVDSYYFYREFGYTVRPVCDK